MPDIYVQVRGPDSTDSRLVRYQTWTVKWTGIYGQQTGQMPDMDRYIYTELSLVNKNEKIQICKLFVIVKN